MDKEYCAKAAMEAGRNIGDGIPGLDRVQRPTASEMLNMKAKELRDEAFRLETLARELEHMGLTRAAETTLCNKLSRALFS